MLVLWEGDEIAVSDIGQRLFLDSATLTPLLKRMETARLVQRARAVADERQVIVSLTARGRKLREKALGMPAKVLCAADYSPGEVATMIRKLGTDRKSTRLNSSHYCASRMPSSA